MKTYLKAVVILAVMGFSHSVVHAATQPSTMTDFSSTNTESVLSVHSKGWSDPAFGKAGWTHRSKWGNFTAVKGRVVTIKLVAADPGVHPGVTVWYRGADDTAPDTYVPDHFYVQNADWIKFGATDEGTGAKLGNIIMQHVVNGYDLDGNTQKVAKFKGKIDGVPGQLELKFKAPETGSYQFVVGGFNPDASLPVQNYDIDTMVTTRW